MALTSAAPIISLLDEDAQECKTFALQKLDGIVNTFWPEISEVVDKIELLEEDVEFPHRELAALVVSKVYYHLNSFEESVGYALAAGDLFDITERSQYIETILSKCIDQYILLRQKVYDCSDVSESMDPRLENTVSRIIEKSLTNKQYRLVAGISLESRRLDILNRAINESDDKSAMLKFCLSQCNTSIDRKMFRQEVLDALVVQYRKLADPDYITMCQCLIFLNRPEEVAEILRKLVETDRQFVACQIGFDMYDSATQQFLMKVQEVLFGLPPPAEDNAEKMDVDPVAEPTAGSTTAATEGEVKPPVDDGAILSDQMKNLRSILTGEKTIELYLQFLIRNNKSDMQILKQTKESIRNSVCHSSTVIANSFMNCGTTYDQFLRDNLDWLGRASNWAKFTATASVGVIHKGHEKESLNLMQLYLPKESTNNSPYVEGAGLYALGMIHANHGAQVSDYLLNQLKATTNETVMHGGCLGLGLAAMGTARVDIYEQLKTCLHHDDAVTGEAAGIAMGLVMAGTGDSTSTDDLVAYAHETQHEKIQRGLAVGIAITMYRKEEEADALIEALRADKDPLMRRSAMFVLSMAYCGTGNYRAIRQLLHVTVSDVNDDVRRAACTAIGFILFQSPEQCPNVVSLLSESYNPHVRVGAAMALGIACSGSGNKEALALLEPMVNDSINYVRQGALIASALVLVQQTEATCPKVKFFRDLYVKCISDKHEDVMAKFGAILSQGIIDAGGRNVTIKLQSRTGHTSMPAVIGMLVFTQFWYWYPLAHFLSLSFTPTCLVCLNKDLQMPKMQIKSNAKPSMYAYPPPLETKKSKGIDKVETAVLSYTAKQKAKDKKKKDSATTLDEAMDLTSSSSVSVKETATSKEAVAEPVKEAGQQAAAATAAPSAVKAKVSKVTLSTADAKAAPASKTTKEDTRAPPEPSFEMLDNPARVMSAQLRVISLDVASRYKLTKDASYGGIIMVMDKTSDEPEEIVQTMVAHGPTKPVSAEDAEEPAPPEPFVYTEE